jgi:prolyl-tRNA editing enzyme YbaK/EbsC (Cys-tRNA(Pro) deacylase)
MAKVVPLRDRNSDWIIAVLPALLHVDLEALAAASGTSRLQSPSERDRIRRFGPEAPAPFAELVGVPVYVDNTFDDGSHIYFETGDQAGVIGIRLQDYVRVARPSLGRFARAAPSGQ